MDLTGRQREILSFVKAFLEERGYPPTRQEIAEAFGFRSVNAAEQHLRALEAKGAITIAAGVSRGISLPLPAKARKPAHPFTG